KSNNVRKDSKYCLELEDGGYYWYLVPYFEKITEETGQWIELYEIAVFFQDDLDSLSKGLNEAKDSINDKPNEWKVSVGIQIHPGNKKKELFYLGNKEKMLEIIDKLLQITKEAKEQNLYLIFFGD
ncbi:MAG: hypothetical protein ACFE8P_10035, partial [Promethearchaeota archaeon]